MPRVSVVQPRRAATAVATAMALLAAAPIRAEGGPDAATDDAAAEQPDPSDGSAQNLAATPNPAGVVLPAEKSTAIQAHWTARRVYMRDRDERRAADEEQRVRALEDELGIRNLFAIGAALVRESHEAIASGSPQVAVQRCRLAVEFAPALAAAHACLARAFLAEHPFAVHSAARELEAALVAGWRDPRVFRAGLANALGIALAGLLVAGLAFVLVLVLRHGTLYVHDVHHLFPSGVRKWQTRTVAVLLLLAPFVLQMGIVPLLFTAVAAIAIYLSTAEAAVSVAFLAALAASPWIARSIARAGALAGPAVDVWLVENGDGAGPEVQRLQKRFEHSNELAVALALAHRAKRDGDLQTAEKIYLRALDAQDGTPLGLAAAHNNLGNVYLLEGETAKALQQYQQAIDIRETLAAPHFNVSRALAMGGVDTLDKVQREQARAMELDRAAVERFAGGAPQASRRANKFVMDAPIDPELFAAFADADDPVADPVADEVRAMLAAGLPAQFGWLVPLAAAAVVVALQRAKNRILPSGRCDRCGREVCRRCDPDSRPNEALCAQCVNVFVRRAAIDASERLRKEFAVESYHRRRRLLARGAALLCGAGHVLIGHPIAGLLYLLATSSLAASLALWKGLVRDPVAARSGLSLLRFGVTAALLLALYGICVRDLLARQRAEEGG